MRHRALVAALLAVLAWPGPAIPAHAADCTVAWGAFVEGVPASLDPLTRLEQQTGLHAAIVHAFHGWGKRGEEEELDSRELDEVRAHGAIPFISWEPEGVALNDINTGLWDPYIDRWAGIFAAYGRPIMLAPLPEMDQTDRSYGWSVNGNTYEDIVAVWRRLHDHFAAAGAANVMWVFDPAGDAARSSGAQVQQLYPGDDYADWLAVNPFNGSAKEDRPWTALADLLQPLYDRVATINPDKPIMLGDFGSVEEGGDRAGWLLAAGREIPTRFPRVKAAVYFNGRDPARPDVDWRLETSQASLDAARIAFGEGTPFCLALEDPDSAAARAKRTLIELAVLVAIASTVVVFGLTSSGVGALRRRRHT